ncbi:hypothetical protein MFLAVUS_000640 [Mucor flavus]|uniref:F-box domain-containing protein n=1 Tax=Mucor flavus TaxID=439312 RepID=A0ABP9YK95_9FUNG
MLLGSRNFPTEIFDNILFYLSRSALYQCIYVCKEWSSSASVLFYKELTVENDIPGITDLSHPIYQYNDILEKLIVTESASFFLQDQPFIKNLLYDFPNLKVLDFSNSQYLFHESLRCIISNPRVNLPRIQEIIVHKHPDALTEVTTSSETLTRCHIKLCKLVHQTITCLTFSYINLPRWMECIHIYTKLTHLTIHNNYAFRSLEVPVESLMAFFLRQCPSLIEFTLLNSFYLPDNYDMLPRDIEALCRRVYEYEQSIPISNEIIQECLPSTPHFNLTTLSLALSTINTSQMKHVISYMPSLKSFKLILTRTNVHTWLKKNCRRTILQFANHLSLIKDVVFTMSELSSSVTVESIGPFIDQHTDLLCTLLNTLKGSSRKFRSSYTRFPLFFKQRRPVNQATNFSFQTKNDQHLHFEYAIAYADFMSSYHTNLSSPFLLAVSPIVMVGEKKKELDIIVTNNEPNGVVRYALANFNHIDILRIYTHKLNIPESDLDHHYVVKYVREYGMVSANIKDLPRVSKNSFPDIRVLTLEDDRLWDQHVKPTSRYLLSRSYGGNLTYEDEECSEEEDEEYYPDEEGYPDSTFSFDLTNHKCLQELHLSASWITDKDYLVLIIFKKTIDSKESETSFHTYHNVSGKYKQIKNDSQLERGYCANYSKYTMIFVIRTVSNITFSIF